MHIWSDNGSSAQLWTAKELDDGTTELVNLATGRCLDISGGSQDNGANAQVWSENDSAAQRWSLVSNDDGTFTIVYAADTGKALDVEGGRAESGTNVRLWDRNGTAAQKWTLVDETLAAIQHSIGLKAGHLYTMRSEVDPTEVLDVDGGRAEDGSNVHIWSDNGSSAQLWTAKELDDGTTELVNLATGRCLDISGGSQDNGANAQVWSENDSAAQRWSLVSNDDGTFTIVYAADTGKALDVEGGRAESGTNVRLWDRNGTAAQKWTLVDYTEARNSLDALAQSCSSSLTPGDYVISFEPGARKVLDGQGSQVLSCDLSMFAWQQWNISFDERGYAVIRNLANNEVLSLDGSCISGGKVVLSTDSGRYDQRWIIEKSGQWFTVFSAVEPDVALDVLAGSTANGSVVQAYGSNGTAAQRWLFYSLSPSYPVSSNVQAGWYRLLWEEDRSRAISGTSGLGTEVASASNDYDQYFYISSEGNGYVLKCGENESDLAVHNAEVIPGAKVELVSTADSQGKCEFSIVANQNGTYSLINQASGLSLSVSGTDRNAGLTISAEAYRQGDSKEQFYLERVSLLSEGIHVIASQNGQELLVAADGSDNVKLESRTRTSSQKWLVSESPYQNGSYYFESLSSGKRLTADKSSGNVRVSEAASEAEYQEWRPHLYLGALMLENVGTGKFLDVTGGILQDGTNVQVWASNHSAAQLFSVKCCSAVDDGYYIVHSADNTAYVMDVAGGGLTNLSNVQAYEENDSYAQRWYVAREGKYYSIRNDKSGLYLDVYCANSSSGTNVEIYQYGEEPDGEQTASQLWSIDYVGNGAFQLVSALNSSIVLTIDGATTNAANLSVSDNTMSSRQKWTFSPTRSTADETARLNGIDVSSWQRGIDISALSSCDFVIVKATEGTGYVNDCLAQQADSTLQSGKLLGLYHFADSGNSAVDEATHFVNAAMKYLGKAAFVLDWESNAVSQGVDWAKTWLDTVYRLTGVKPLIYMSHAVTNEYDWSSVAATYKLWGAQYATIDSVYGFDENPWSDGTAWGAWGDRPTIQQYSSNGHLDNYGSSLDFDVFYGSGELWNDLEMQR